MATYFDLHIFQLIIQIKSFPVLNIKWDLNYKYKNPRMFGFVFKIFKWGINTDKEYAKECSVRIDEYMKKQKKEKEKFVSGLTEEQINMYNQLYY
jgi:hypothetical protein